MSNDSEKNGKGVKLISFVTRRLVEGPKGEFIKAMNKHFSVHISTKNGNDTHVTIRGSEDNIRAASEFLRLLDQKAEVFANERNLVRTGQVHDKEWGHMRIEFQDALKRQKPSAAPKQPLAKDELPDTHLSDVFEDNAKAKQVAKESQPEPRRGKTASGFYPKNPSQAVGSLALRDSDVSVIILEGPGGCGKTHLAVSHAIDVHNGPDYDHILFFRPRTVTSKDSMGAMPGGPEEKMDFYTAPFAHKVKEITGKPISNYKKIQRLTPDGQRGESHGRTLIVVDEAHNLTVSEAKMLLTRMSQGSKIIICGDISSNQNDIGAEMPGLAHILATQAAKANRGNAVLQKGMAVVSFTESDTSARHHMMPSINEAFNNPVAEYAELMDKITSFRRNAQLIQAIEEAVKFSRKELHTASDATFARYKQVAQSAYPSIFGIDNVVALQPAAHVPGHRLG